MLILLDVFIFLAFFLFFVSVFGIILSHNNMLYLLISLEILLLASNIVFVVSACFFDDISGQIFAIFALTVAASESVVGLSLLILFYRTRGTLEHSVVNLIKG